MFVPGNEFDITVSVKNNGSFPNTGVLKIFIENGDTEKLSYFKAIDLPVMKVDEELTIIETVDTSEFSGGQFIQVKLYSQSKTDFSPFIFIDETALKFGQINDSLGLDATFLYKDDKKIVTELNKARDNVEKSRKEFERNKYKLSIQHLDNARKDLERAEDHGWTRNDTVMTDLNTLRESILMQAVDRYNK